MKRLSKTASPLSKECNILEETVEELREELKVFEAHLDLAKRRLNRLCKSKGRGRPPKNPIDKK